LEPYPNWKLERPTSGGIPVRHFQDLSITRRCTEFEQLMSANDSNHDVTTVC